MRYISIGAVTKRGTEHVFEVSHCGNDFTLAGELARMWLSGRTQFSEPESFREETALRQLLKMGLVVTAELGAVGSYRALTQCRVIPAKRNNPYAGLFGKERIVLKWLNEAGLRLTMGELVFLMDRGIAPTPALLGTEHQQALVETIYTKQTIFDNILENQMEQVPARDEVVKLVLSLLRKKRVVLL